MAKMVDTCGIFIIYKDQILICHATGAKYNQWSIPKGLSEKDENPLEAAIRECKEETNIDINKVSSEIIPMGISIYKSGKKKLHGFLAYCDKDIPRIINCNSYTPEGKPEIDRFAWMDFDDALPLLHHAQQELWTSYWKKLE